MQAHGVPRRRSQQQQQRPSVESVEVRPRDVSPAAPHRGPEAYATIHFAHNLRMWAFAAPCCAVCLLLGGQSTTVAAALGLLVCYALDIIDSKEGTLLAFWATMIVSGAILLASSTPLLSLQNAFIGLFLCLLTAWGTLQFRWLLREEPLGAAVVEMVLFALWPLPCVVIITWATTAVVGFEFAAVALLLTLYAALALYGPPLCSMLTAAQGGAALAEVARKVTLWHSSTPAAAGNGNRAASAVAAAAAAAASSLPSLRERAQGTVHVASTVPGAVMTGSMLFLPAITRIAVSRRTTVTGGGGNGDMALATELFALLALPWLLLWSLMPRGILWWTPFPPAAVARFLAVAATAAAIVMVESCISLFLLDAFRPYFAPECPWDRIALSGAIYLAAAASFVRQRRPGNGRGGSHSGGGGGGGSNRQNIMVMRALVVASSRCLGYLFGVGQLVMLVFDAAALGLAAFIDSGALAHYAAAAVGASMAILWFSHRTLWFLDYSFPALSGDVGGGGSNDEGMTLRNLTVALAALAMLTLSLPALATSRAPPAAVGTVCAVHAAALAAVEGVLVQAGRSDPQIGDVYPLGLVIVTAVAGLWMTARLAFQGLLGENGALGPALRPAACLHTAKFLAAAVLSSGEATGGFWSTFTAAAALTLALGTALSSAVTGDAAGGAVPAAAAAGGFGVAAREMAGGSARRGDSDGGAAGVRTAALFAATSGALAWAASPVTLPLVRAVLGGRSPEESAGAYAAAISLAAAAVVLLHLVGRHGHDAAWVRRVAATMLAAAAVAAVLGRSGTLKTGGALPAGAFLCLMAGITAVLGLMGVLPLNESVASRATASVFIGGALGAAAAKAAVPASDAAAPLLLQLPFVAVAALSNYVILELWARPPPRRRAAAVSAAAPRLQLLPWVYAALLVAGPAVLGAAAAARRLSRQAAAQLGMFEQDFLAALVLCHLAVAIATGPLRQFVLNAGGSAASAAAGYNGVFRAAAAMARAGSAPGRRWGLLLGDTSTVAAYLCGLGLTAARWHGEGERALAAAGLSLLLLLRPGSVGGDGGDGLARTDVGPHAPWAAPVVSAWFSWALLASYYILVKDLVNPWPRRTGFPGGPTAAAIAHAERLFTGADAFRVGAAATASRLQMVSLWNGVSPWAPPRNLLLAALTVPALLNLRRFLATGRPRRDMLVVAAAAVSLLPAVGGDMVSIHLMGLLGALGGGAQMWLTRQQRERGKRLI
ncbi:unnamed protein product [Phaeothamnion confervicola]